MIVCLQRDCALLKLFQVATTRYFDQYELYMRKVTQKHSLGLVLAWLWIQIAFFGDIQYLIAKMCGKARRKTTVAQMQEHQQQAHVTQMLRDKYNSLGSPS